MRVHVVACESQPCRDPVETLKDICISGTKPSSTGHDPILMSASSFRRRGVARSIIQSAAPADPLGPPRRRLGGSQNVSEYMSYAEDSGNLRKRKLYLSRISYFSLAYAPLIVLRNFLFSRGLAIRVAIYLKFQ